MIPMMELSLPENGQYRACSKHLFIVFSQTLLNHFKMISLNFKLSIVLNFQSSNVGPHSGAYKLLRFIAVQKSFPEKTHKSKSQLI